MEALQWPQPPKESQLEERDGMDINEADSRHYECQLKRRQNAVTSGWIRGFQAKAKGYGCGNGNGNGNKTETQISNSGISDNSISHDVPKCLLSI